jgi:ankyrin repeat protein
VDSADEEGRTALHYSVDLSNNEIMQFLMNSGADPNFKDKSGSAPFDEVEPTDEAYAILARETI